MSIRGLSSYYGDREIVKGVDIEIMKNSITAIIGPSGCGKSTFIKSLNMMVEEEKDGRVQGSIIFDGSDIVCLPRQKLREKIGMVFQTPTPFPLTIYQNMTYGPTYHGIRDKKRLKAIAQEKLMAAGLYDEVKGCMDMPAKKLSGGQQQRLCIARALTVEPSMLLLDEPCSALDVRNTANIEDMLLRLSNEYTIIIVTHNLMQAKRIADYTMFMFDGEIVEYSDTKSLFESPENEKTKQYIEGVFG